MDLIILIGIATTLFAICVALYFTQRKIESKETQRPTNLRPQENVPRRAQIVRNQRNRLRQGIVAQVDPANDADEGNDEENTEIKPGAVLDEKMGTKKRAKLEAKEQKRLLREQELKLREERRAKEAKQEEERKKQEELEAEEEKNKMEAERLAKEERERKEHEEYLKIKAAFTIEEEGFDGDDDDDRESLLSNFVQYIKDNKVVILEELATNFKLKTQEVIDRIQELQANGTITGVIDDRGKFIYVSEAELSLVAKFIKQRGRVSIAELAESSNNLINLTPVASV